MSGHYAMEIETVGVSTVMIASIDMSCAHREISVRKKNVFLLILNKEKRNQILKIDRLGTFSCNVYFCFLSLLFKFVDRLNNIIE